MRRFKNHNFIENSMKDPYYFSNLSKENEKYTKRYIKVMSKKQRMEDIREENPLEAMVLNALNNIQMGYYYFVGKL